MKKKTIKLELSLDERIKLKARKISLRNIHDYAPDELAVILDVSLSRVREIFAQIEFQQIPSVGIRFAQDLISMGIYEVEQLKGKDAAALVIEFEKQQGYWIDPCLEDQFRLIVHVANTGDTSRNWWDFTSERKKYHLENGYPADRPKLSWYEFAGLSGQKK